MSDTAHAARAQSLGIVAKIGSSNVVQSHKIRTKVGIRLVFFDGGQRKPVIQRGAARFARVEGEVRAEDFLEGNANANQECVKGVLCPAHPACTFAEQQNQRSSLGFLNYAPMI